MLSLFKCYLMYIYYHGRLMLRLVIVIGLSEGVIGRYALGQFEISSTITPELYDTKFNY